MQNKPFSDELEITNDIQREDDAVFDSLDIPADCARLTVVFTVKGNVDTGTYDTPGCVASEDREIVGAYVEYTGVERWIDSGPEFEAIEKHYIESRE